MQQVFSLFRRVFGYFQEFHGNMQKSCKQKFIFGPVESRRLGRSLGINLVPFKTCSMDCIYCECGSTTVLTNTRKEFFPVEYVLEELDEVLSQRKQKLGEYALDYVTFSGLGEPTLSLSFGEIVSHVKKNYPFLKICLLTNASLFCDPAVRDIASQVNLVIPSLDGSNEEEFMKINRPEKSVTFEKIIAGIMDFRRESIGKCRMFLEIFLVPGINDSLQSAERFRVLAEKIRPDAVQLNFLDRPGLFSSLKAVSPHTLDMFAKVLEKSVPVEIPAVKKRSTEKTFTEIEFNLLELFQAAEKPCRLAFLAEKLSLPEEEAVRHLRNLRSAGFAEEIFDENGAGGSYAITEKAVIFMKKRNGEK